MLGEELPGPVGVQDDLVDGQAVQGAARLRGGLGGGGRGQRGSRIHIGNGTGIIGVVVITIQIGIGIQIAVLSGKLDVVVPGLAFIRLIFDTVCIYGWVRNEGGAISTNGIRFRG